MNVGTPERDLPEPTAEQRRRNPCITAAGAALLRQMQQHESAPRWNHAAGDRLQRADLDWLDTFRGALATAMDGGSAARGRTPAPPASVPDWLLAWLERLRPDVAAFETAVPEGLDPARDWARIATMAREDVATHVERFVPRGADLEDLIVYRTAGTTGHALLVPHAARAAAAYHPLLEIALARHGVRIGFDASRAGCFLVGAQARTVTYPTVLSAWNNTGFAKLNLAVTEWPAPRAAHAFFEAFQPPLLTGDPISFAEMLRQEIPARPAAMVTTAVAMSAGLKRRLGAQYGCPVIDWYSLTETGPIAYGCAAGHGYHLLAHDLHVEVLDAAGQPVADGATGEITVSGGRNPFLPLLRYRTGDWGRLDRGACACGDPMPRLLDLEGRQPVIFRAADGAVVNPVDISRVLRELPLVQHELAQARDGACVLTLRPLGDAAQVAGQARALLAGLLGAQPLTVVIDPDLGARTGKTTPYRSEWLLED